MEETGFIVTIAYPDTIVRVANGELISKLWPVFGVGGKNKVQAGHAALLLISKKNNTIEYFDFGRYITSDTFGRVRSEQTDYEVHIPMKAKHDGKEIKNLKEVLLFLEDNPEKTHGEGRMVVSVNHKINHAKAKKFISELQSQNHVPYGAFKKNSTNCARFVTDALIQSCVDSKIVQRLQRSKYLTPSPISNVINGGSCNNSFFEIFHQEIKVYNNKSIAKEHWECFFNKVCQNVDEIGTVLPDTLKYNNEKAQWLGGIGSGAWFEIYATNELKEYQIIRKNKEGIVDVDAVFRIATEGFYIEKAFRFLHGSNGLVCYISQNAKVYEFNFLKKTNSKLHLQ